MRELRLHAIGLSLNPAPGDFRLFVCLEDSSLATRKIYESRLLTNRQPGAPVLIGEAFRVNFSQAQLFLKFVIEYNSRDAEPPAEPGKFAHQARFYVFVEDLMQSGSSFAVDISKSQSATLFFDLNGDSLAASLHHSELFQSQASGLGLSRSQSLAEEKEKDKYSPENDPGMVEQYRVTLRYVRKITPIRRLETELKAFLGERNPNRDLAALAGVLAFLHFGAWLILGLVVSLLFSDWRFRLRNFLVLKAEQMFAGATAAAEIKKNLLYIREQQLMLMGLVKTIRGVLYTNNREALFVLLNTTLIPVLAAAAVLCLVPLRTVLSVVFISIFVAKYRKRAEQASPAAPENGRLLQQLAKHLNFWKHYAPSHKKRKLVKQCYVYENQRWFISQGFLGKTFPGGRLNRARGVFGLFRARHDR